MQLNQRPQYGSKEKIKNEDVGELQLRVEQTSEIRNLDGMKRGLSPDDGTQITMRNLMKKKDTDQIKDQSNIREDS
jgi:hypothetical protein